MKETEASNLPCVVESTPRQELQDSAAGVEIVLGLLAEAVCRDLVTWSEEAEAAGYGDELALTTQDIVVMPVRLRCGYVARLVRLLARELGFEIDDLGLLTIESPQSLGMLLREPGDSGEDPDESPSPSIPGADARWAGRGQHTPVPARELDALPSNLLGLLDNLVAIASDLSGSHDPSLPEAA